MQKFRDLHIREAGRETRSEESWKRQFEMVKADEAFVIFGTFEIKLVTAGLFSYNKTISINGDSMINIGDTLKALSKATICGYVHDENGLKLTDFNGVVIQ